MNFNDVVANNWKKDQILRFLLLQNLTFWSIKKIRMKFTTEYTCSHPYKRFCTRISSIFIIIVVEAVVWSHRRNMDSKKKRNVNENMYFLRHLVNNHLRCHIMAHLQRIFSVKGAKLSTLLMAQ